VPIIYKRAHHESIEVSYSNGNIHLSAGAGLSEIDSKSVLQRNGEIIRIKVFIDDSKWRD
jgi:hypothetical protein